MKKCLPASIDDKTKICIVGTMPGEESLNQQRYYAHKRNYFWPFMQQIFGDSVTTPEDLLAHRIGLWDALDVCERNGSLDLNIKNGIPNDFSRYPQVRYYLFNGKKAYQFFTKGNKELLTDTNHRVLPSTSPANASQKLEYKLNQWKKAIDFFLNQKSEFR